MEKWGTIKGYSAADNSEALPLLKEYMAGWNAGNGKFDHPDEERKMLLCEAIDKFDGTIKSHWTGEEMTKEEAKKHVMEYR